MPGQQPRTQLPNPVGCVGRRGGRRVRDGGKDFRPPFFSLPRKTLRERTADAGRNDDAMRLGPARASKERFSLPQRRILHSGTAIHGLERTWGTTCVLRAYFYGRSARLLSFIRFTHLKLSKPMAVLCIDEKVWQAFVGRLETLAERARLLEHRYEPRTDSS